MYYKIVSVMFKGKLFNFIDFKLPKTPYFILGSIIPDKNEMMAIHVINPTI